MAIHPQCPCSRASIANLQHLLDHHKTNLACDLYVYRPEAKPLEWSDTWTVAQAKRLPSIRVFDDPDGAAAQRFGVQTSGGVVLYSQEGVAVYYGGVTPSRGHEGPNAGLQAIEDALAGRTTSVVSRPTYGCPLVAAEGSAL